MKKKLPKLQSIISSIDAFVWVELSPGWGRTRCNVEDIEDASRLKVIPDGQTVCWQVGIGEAFLTKDSQVCVEEMLVSELHKCDNCSKLFVDRDLKEMKDISMRVGAGEPMPSGECPECGAVCHPAEFACEEPEIPTVVLYIEGGAIHCVNSSVKARVIVLDRDTEGADEDSLTTVDGEEVSLHDFLLVDHVEPGGEGVCPEFAANIIKQVEQHGGDAA